jgi:hypothetical protein
MWIALVYGVGVAIGLVATDGGPASRIGLALAWPLGPLAFLITVAGLIVVAAIAFPVFGLVLAAAGVAWWFR